MLSFSPGHATAIVQSVLIIDAQLLKAFAQRALWMLSIAARLFAPSVESICDDGGASGVFDRQFSHACVTRFARDDSCSFIREWTFMQTPKEVARSVRMAVE